jgi:hypothetical protein
MPRHARRAAPAAGHPPAGAQSGGRAASAPIVRAPCREAGGPAAARAPRSVRASLLSSSCSHLRQLPAPRCCHVLDVGRC